MIDYIRDGQAIYRQSFATIRAEANLAGIPADLEKLAVRVIHACGMVDVVDDLRFSPGAGAAGARWHLLPWVRALPLGAYCWGRLTASLGRYKPLILLGAVLLPCGIA
ncbi:precorrin-8X methylmutase, partial [Pseudomonas aeruginosa]|uniref:precorrin-8X methylmutase n=1 Tax=Pseudomonas aeruginosa TaxID=287 RepID=UPI0021563215